MFIAHSDDGDLAAPGIRPGHAIALASDRATEARDQRTSSLRVTIVAAMKTPTTHRSLFAIDFCAPRSAPVKATRKAGGRMAGISSAARTATLLRGADQTINLKSTNELT